jgi:PAS domain S-box-containing protein
VFRLLEGISDTVLVLDRDWRFVYLNPRALEEAGEPAAALLGRTLWEKYPALLGTDVEAHYRRAVAEQVATHFETRGVRTGRWWDIHAYPSAGGLLVYGRDVSERRRAEDALRASEQHFRAIAELTSDYAYSCSVGPDGRIRIESATEGFGRVTGYTVDELEASGGWAALIPPEEGAAAEAVGRRMASGEAVVHELRIRTRDGRLRWIRFSTRPTWDAAGTRVTGLLGAVQDVTERRLAEEALRASEERFHGFMDHSPAVAWVKDEQLRIVYVNRPWEQRFGQTAAAVRGLTDLDLRPVDVAERLRAHDRAVLASDRAMECEEAVPDAGGALRHWQVFKFPFRDAAGARFVGGMALDVTERLRDREALRGYAGRLRELSRRLLEVQEQERRHLARELHDEVGQLLTGLHLALGAAGAPARDLDGARALVRELTGRVRALSLRLRPTMLDDLGLVPALLWLCDNFTQRTGIRVAFRHGGLSGRLPPEVETAAYRIAQEALTNVARHAGVREASARAWLTGGRLHLEVEDEGAGFDPAAAGAGGPSAGLSGMQERAALLGGRLSVESSPGRGTRVAAVLPCGPAEGGDAP